MSKAMTDEQRKLAEENMNLVYHLIGKEYPTFLYDEDIVQSGFLGLCCATMKWKEEKGKFSTFACACIRNAIRMELRSRQAHASTLSLDYLVTEDKSLGDTLACSYEE